MVLVDVGEHAAREHEVEVVVGIWEGWQLTVAVELDVGEVLRRPLERIGVDIRTVQITSGRESLHPHDHATTAAAEVQDPRERVERAAPRSQRLLDVDRAGAPGFAKCRRPAPCARCVVLELVGGQRLVASDRVDP